MEEKIVLQDEFGGEITLYAVEETRGAGVNYLLAADDEGDGECYILRDISQAEDAEAVYEDGAGVFAVRLRDRPTEALNP